MGDEGRVGRRSWSQLHDGKPDPLWPPGVRPVCNGPRHSSRAAQGTQEGCSTQGEGVLAIFTCMWVWHLYSADVVGSF